METGKGDRYEGAPRRRATTPSRPPIAWLPPLLFRLTLALALILAALVAVTPLLDPGTSLPRGGRMLALFARDLAVRRTALASAAGLAVTAWVFFRTPIPVRSAAPRKPPRVPPPTNMAGA
jgi:hypothetical protein